jgi:peptidylprolyl isomerase
MKNIIVSAILITFVMLTGCNAKDLNNTKAETNTKKEILVTLETSHGEITLRMFPEVAPLAVENFVTHAKNGYYDGLIFHRVIKNFMIQGGDPTGTGRGGESIWKKEFVNEYAPNVVFDRPFLLAMANKGPNTNGSQFFITTVPTPFLNGGYTIFGEVLNGQEVVQKIENTKTGHGDRPTEKQMIKKAIVKS